MGWGFGGHVALRSRLSPYRFDELEIFLSLARLFPRYAGNVSNGQLHVLPIPSCNLSVRICAEHLKFFMLRHTTNFSANAEISFCNS